MAEQKVELRKIRDFSENLNDTILFIRQNLKPLVSSFLAIAGLFMLSHAILNGMYQSSIGSLFKDLLNGMTVPRNQYQSPYSTMFGGAYSLVLLLGWANFIAMNVVVTCYMKLYDASIGQAPSILEVWDEFKKHFLKVFFYTIPITLLTVIGMLFCLVPGIYLATVMAPFAVILIIENETFGGAWSRCLAIIKGNFWPSLGLYLLVYLIVAFSAGIIAAIFSGIAGTISYLTTRNVVTTIGVVTSVLNIFSYIFYIVLYVSINLHYFNLTERHDGTGILKRLDSFGSNDDSFNNPQEQY